LLADHFGTSSRRRGKAMSAISASASYSASERSP
jgi:hypothetical protein